MANTPTPLPVANFFADVTSGLKRLRITVYRHINWYRNYSMEMGF